MDKGFLGEYWGNLIAITDCPDMAFNKKVWIKGIKGTQGIYVTTKTL